MSRALITPIASQSIPAVAMGTPNSHEAHKLDVFYLLKRKFFFILFFVLVGLALSVLYFFKIPKTYESTAKIFVDEKSAPSANSNDKDPDNESPVEKYVEVIKSAKILNPAIIDGNFHQLKTFQFVDDILFELRQEGKLDVLPADTKNVSGVIRLAARGATEEECQLILQHVVRSFDDYIKSTTKNLGGETAKLVERMQDQLTGRLKVVNDEIQTLVGRPELLSVDGHWVNPYHTEQIQLQDDLHELLREKNTLVARVKNIRKSRNAKNEQALVVEILQEFNETQLGSYVATHNQFVELKVAEQQMLNQFGEQHPDLIAIRKQISMLDNLRKEELSSLQRGQSGTDGKPGDMIDIFLELMDGKIEMLTLEQESLQEELLKAQAKSQALSTDVEQLKSLQRERDQLELGYAAIVERLSEIKAYETHLWRNMTELDPPTLGEQVAPSLPISLAGGLLLGSLVGFMFAGFKEIAEKTFRSSEDITAYLGTRVIGHIHQFHRSGVRKSSSYPNVAHEVIALHQPASLTSEAYRAIRTSIFFKTQEVGAKVIQVTSPTPGDGKSTTISNLAASISQAGRRVLVIDADFRKPVQHKLFGLSNSIGVTSILMGEVDPDEAIQVIQEDYLSVLTCGPIPANPAELLTSNRFAAIIEHFRDDFDFILVDSPPVLAVTDPTIICGHVDLVYLVMRIRNGCRTNAMEAKEIVDSIGIELGGIVVNGLRRRDQKSYEYSGHHGYGRYKYGKRASIAAANESL